MPEPVREHAIRVLVVDDEPVAARAHADYVRRVEGFTVAAVAGSTREAVDALQEAQRLGRPVELILLDMNLREGHGLDLLRRVRGLGLMPDTIAITAVRELHIVRSAIALGVVHYLLKPFAFPAFREKLEAYRAFHAALDRTPAGANQAMVDEAFSMLRPRFAPPLPKGLLAETLELVAGHLERSERPLSSTEVADALQLSRVTARRYLERLAEEGRADKAPRHGQRGRPELEYGWRR